MPSRDHAAFWWLAATAVLVIAVGLVSDYLFTSPLIVGCGSGCTENISLYPVLLIAFALAYVAYKLGGVWERRWPREPSSDH